MTPGGVAPWLPWHVLQVGAEVSPRLRSAVACTLVDQSAKAVACFPKALIRAGSAWHCAGLRGVERRHRRSRVAHASHPVRTVAVGASGDPRLALGHRPAVGARQILRQLIDAPGVELTHVGRIAVAFSRTSPQSSCAAPCSRVVPRQSRHDALQSRRLVDVTLETPSRLQPRDPALAVAGQPGSPPAARPRYRLEVDAGAAASSGEPP